MTQSFATVFVDGERDRITARSGKIEYDINFTNLKSGLIPFIQEYGDLYYGKFSPEYFKQTFNATRSLFLKNLIRAPELTNWKDYCLYSSSFYMFMTRVCQTESWVWPALCVRRSDSTITQTSGISRIVATGMCKKDPWSHLNALFLESKNKDPSLILTDAVKVDNDQTLHQKLNLEFSTDTFQTSQAKLSLTVDASGDLIFDYINNHRFHDTITPETQTLWTDLVSWHQKYSKPRLKIYTDWPELVDNQENFWDIEIAGPSKPIYQSIFYPGHIEREIQLLHGSNPEKNLHVMHIIKPRYINVTELLCWLNTKHTTFIDRNFEFIVYRADENYSNTFVDLSYISTQ
jgi:hypothetical protein